MTPRMMAVRCAATRSFRAIRVARVFRAAASTRASDEHVEWTELSPARRMAWTALGWNADSWSGTRAPPMSELSTWSELGADERAAAQHGLGYDARGGFLRVASRQSQTHG